MESKTTAIAAVKQEVRLQEWSAQIEAQQAKQTRRLIYYDMSILSTRRGTQRNYKKD